MEYAYSLIVVPVIQALALRARFWMLKSYSRTLFRDVRERLSILNIDSEPGLANPHKIS
jgi:hypothetical protein